MSWRNYVTAKEEAEYRRWEQELRELHDRERVLDTQVKHFFALADMRLQQGKEKRKDV